jgi:AGZA family xanthine/uracil permease-like MFS transporter
LLSTFLAPLAGVIPAQATAPALILVGFYMMGIVREIPWTDYEEAIPAFVIMLAMPFTWSITNGIGAGFVTYTVIKLFAGKAGQVHWMMYLVSGAFVVYFVLPLLVGAK